MTFAIEMISQYGYYAVFGLLALGIIGLPVPDELLMLFIGYLSSIMVLNYSVSLLVSFMGAITGMLLSYTLGKTFGQPLIDKHGKWVGLTTKRFEKVKGWFARFGLWTLFFGYFHSRCKEHDQLHFWHYIDAFPQIFAHYEPRLPYMGAYLCYNRLFSRRQH